MSDSHTKYPPRNRVVKPHLHRKVLAMEIEHAGGLLNVDPNGLAIMAARRKVSALEPAPGQVSVLSGAPAVVFADMEVTLALTPMELERMAMRALRPAEFLKLAQTYGIFHEIHDDFYDESSGLALQPKREYPDDAEDGAASDELGAPRQRH